MRQQPGNQHAVTTCPYVPHQLEDCSEVTQHYVAGIMAEARDPILAFIDNLEVPNA